MRVTGSINGQKIHILVDSGNTHNFTDAITTQKLDCQMSSNPPMIVIVADGNKIQSNQMCARLVWKIQGQAFQIDFLILPLEGCQMVLGIQWLVQLGIIKWNFQQLRMEFDVDNRKNVLRRSLMPRL